MVITSFIWNAATSTLQKSCRKCKNWIKKKRPVKTVSTDEYKQTTQKGGAKRLRPTKKHNQKLKENKRNNDNDSIAKLAQSVMYWLQKQKSNRTQFYQAINLRLCYEQKIAMIEQTAPICIAVLQQFTHLSSSGMKENKTESVYWVKSYSHYKYNSNNKHEYPLLKWTLMLIVFCYHSYSFPMVIFSLKDKSHNRHYSNNLFTKYTFLFKY